MIRVLELRVGIVENMYGGQFYNLFFRTDETIQCTRSPCARIAVSGIEIKFSYVILLYYYPWHELNDRRRLFSISQYRILHIENNNTIDHGVVRVLNKIDLLQATDTSRVIIICIHLS